MIQQQRAVIIDPIPFAIICVTPRTFFQNLVLRLKITILNQAVKPCQLSPIAVPLGHVSRDSTLEAGSLANIHDLLLTRPS